ncbi:MAG: 4Fe-4S dicluster domain-containing protein [Deferribacterales bacterium]
MKQYAFYINVDKCSGCKVCVAACKDKKNLAAGRKFRKVYTCATGEWTLKNGVYEHKNAGGYNISVSCMHCRKPVCIEVCPANAIKKRKDGIVFHDETLCIGCESCCNACPYHAPSFNRETQTVSKCDFCRETIGTEELPACVAACMERALDFGEYSELVKKYGNTNMIQPLPKPVTQPSVVITPHRNYSGKGGMTEVSLPDEVQAYENY